MPSESPHRFKIRIADMLELSASGFGIPAFFVVALLLAGTSVGVLFAWVLS